MSTSNEQERSRTSELAQKLEKTALEMVRELIERNAYAIASELLTSADAGGGFGLKFDLQIVGENVAMESKVSWSRKFADKEKGHFRLSNPQEPGLPGMEPAEEKHDETEVTIITDGKEVKTTAGALKRIAKKAREQQ